MSARCAPAVKGSAGGWAVAGWLGGRLLRRVAELAIKRRPAPEMERLTPREFEIVTLMGQGLTNKEIARRLDVQLSTVKNHTHSIFEKLHVSRRAEAVARVRTWTPP